MGAVDRLLTSLATVRENLKEEEAKSLPNFDGVDIVFNHEGELYRSWVFDTTDLLDLAILYLKTSGYVGPSDLDYVSGRHVITDPLIDGYAVPGVFRVSGVRRVAFQGKYYAVQSLRRGYARNIDWTEAYLAEGHSQIGPFETRLVEFKAFDPECTEQARAALTGQTYTDPVVQKQILSGSWRTMDVIVKPSQDGTYVIGLMLQSVTAATYQYKSLSTAMRSGNTIVYENWPHKIQAPEVTGSGIYRTQNTVNDRLLYDAVLTYEAGTSQGVVPFRSMSTLFRQGNTILYRDWPSKIEAPVASGSGMYRAQNELTDDGLYNSILVYENGTGTGSIDFTSLSTLFRSGSTILYKSWPTKISAPPASGSGLYRVQQSINDDGTYDGALVYENGTGSGEARYASLSTLFRTGNTILYKSSPSVISAPPASGSGLYRVQQSMNDDGTYDGALVYENGTGAGEVSFRSLSTMFRVGNTILYKSSPSAIEAPPATGTGIYRVQQSMTDDGTYDGALVYECGTMYGQAEYKSLSSLNRQGNTILYRSWPVAIVAPPCDGSGVYRVQQALQDDGSYDGALIYEAGVATQQAAFKSLSSMFRQGNTILYRGWPEQVEAPPSDGSGVYRLQQQLRDDNLYDAALIYEVGSLCSKVEYKSLSTMFRIGSTVLYRGWSEKIEAPDAEGSGVYRVVQQSVNEDGSYDATMIYEVGTGEGQVPFRSLSTMFREGNSIVYRSWPVAIEAPTSGQGGIYRAQQSLSDDGTYDGTLVYEIGTPTEFSFVAAATVLSTVRESIYKGVASPHESELLEQGKQRVVSNSVSEDGTYDVTQRDIESSPHAIYKAWNSANGLHAFYVYRNWSTIIEASDYYNNVALSTPIINDDGTYDFVITFSPLLSGGSSGEADDTTSAKIVLDGLYGPKGVGRYKIYVYQKTTLDLAAQLAAKKIANPDTGYIPVPSYGAYHTGVWKLGTRYFQGIVVLWKAS